MALDGMPPARLEAVSMKPPSQISVKPTQAEITRLTRDEAEAAALRANLARRKAQARAKPAKTKDEPQCP